MTALLPLSTPRLEAVASHLDFAWRFARRLGLAPAQADDAVQDAFVITATRIEQIEEGKERAYLTSVVMNMVRRQRSQRVHSLLPDDLVLEEQGPDRALDEKRARAMMDSTLDTLEESLRVVFVLHDIEQETMASIASILELPPGTVASRLRRAREAWRVAVARFETQRGEVVR